MDIIRQYLSLFLDHRDAIDANSTHTLNLLRERALEELERPASQPDAMFAPDFGVNINRIDMPADVAAAFRCDVPNLSTLLAVVVNDSFHPTESLTRRLPEGVTFCSLRQAAAEMPDLIKTHLGSLAPLTDPAIALNTLLAQEGVMIRIAPDVKLEKPLQLVNLFSASAPMMGVRRVLIVVGKGSEATILSCDHTLCPDVDFLSSEVVEIIVEEDARLDFYDMESSTARTARHSDIFVRQHTGSSLTLGCFTLACGNTRRRLSLDITGQGCHTFLGGMAIASASQQIANTTRLRHLAPHSESTQLFKYVLDDEARGAFDGLILVAPDAHHTQAYQSNRNMIASPDARMHTEPQLEIYCDEVKCSHGATTGQLDTDALFYMQTRGIPLTEARIMLMQAFMADVLQSVRLTSLRDRLVHLVERRFAGQTAACGDCIASSSNA